VADAVIVADPGMVIRSFNPAAEALYGWREDEVVGQPVEEVLPWLGHHDALEDSMRRLQQDDRWVGTADQLRRDGTPVQVRAATTIVRDRSGQQVAVISVNRPVVGLSPALPGAVTSAGGEGELHDDLVRAMAAGELLVHYQPVVDLATSRPVGMEALVRWSHPVRGVLSPQEFIGAGERSGAIVELGDLVLADACRQSQRWRQAGHDLHVAVNLSVRQLTDELPARVAALMAATDMPAGMLWLELTETALVSDLDQAKGGALGHRRPRRAHLHRRLRHRLGQPHLPP
jgi:PAS domain S-box-containing protein